MNIGTLLPIIIFAIISIIVIGIIFVLSKKRQQPATQINLMPITPHKDEIKVENIEKKKEEPIKTVEPVKEVEEPKKEIEEKTIEPIKEETKKEEKESSPLINIPINNMDDTPIEIDEAKALVENNDEEMVKVTESKPLEDKKEVIEETKIINEVKEEEPQEVVNTTLIEPVIPDNNEITEVKMIDSAFHQSPNEDREINTNIKVEEKREYLGNKTEILDMEDIKRAMVGKE